MRLLAAARTPLPAGHRHCVDHAVLHRAPFQVGVKFRVLLYSTRTVLCTVLYRTVFIQCTESDIASSHWAPVVRAVPRQRCVLRADGRVPVCSLNTVFTVIRAMP